ncbi:hypothetical protein SLEP1_g50012 [Rubroshorea leprosula]|uniref:Uncharacterized protein n=1 Tax=Rubroshorea leprosula TaxID=152421 RepID=A0AAV5LZZ7_9ROSI|nr:hypothetical protein SLEP1_g50012 [Rubroshorea leprosula]
MISSLASTTRVFLSGWRASHFGASPCFFKAPPLYFLLLFRSPIPFLDLNCILVLGDLGEDSGLHTALPLIGSIGGGLALLWTNVSQLKQSFVSQPPVAIVIVDPGGCHWRLIGFFGRKQEERNAVGEADSVLKGKNSIPIAKGALVLLMNFGNMGLKRIGTVRAVVGSSWRRGRCLGLDGGPCPSC